MFEGKNYMTLNEKETKKAIQYYLNTVVLKKPVEVTSIKPLSPENCFHIGIAGLQLEDKEKT